MLEAKNLDFRYGIDAVLKNVDFKTGEGEMVALIGPNGSGKSTLLRCLCGLLKAAKGEVTLSGQPIHLYGSREIARHIAFLPQFQERLNGITVRELVAMGRTPYHHSGWILTREDKRIIDWAMDYMQIGHFRRRMVDMLSGGERQRVWIAMVLAQDVVYDDTVIQVLTPVVYPNESRNEELI